MFVRAPDCKGVDFVQVGRLRSHPKYPLNIYAIATSKKRARPVRLNLQSY